MFVFNTQPLRTLPSKVHFGSVYKGTRECRRVGKISSDGATLLPFTRLRGYFTEIEVKESGGQKESDLEDFHNSHLQYKYVCNFNVLDALCYFWHHPALNKKKKGGGLETDLVDSWPRRSFSLQGSRVFLLFFLLNLPLTAGRLDRISQEGKTLCTV